MSIGRSLISFSPLLHHYTAYRKEGESRRPPETLERAYKAGLNKCQECAITSRLERTGPIQNIYRCLNTRFINIATSSDLIPPSSVSEVVMSTPLLPPPSSIGNTPCCRYHSNFLCHRSRYSLLPSIPKCSQ